MESTLALEPSLLLDLPTEVLVTVATLLGIEGGEIKRLVDAVGPARATSIRTVYLHANLGYLKYLHDLLAGNTTQTSRGDRARRQIVSAGLTSWMEANPRWRHSLDVYSEEEGVHGVLYDSILLLKEGKKLPESYLWMKQVIYDEEGDDDNDYENEPTDETGASNKSREQLKVFEKTLSGHTAVTHRPNSLVEIKVPNCSGFIGNDSNSVIVGVETLTLMDLVTTPFLTLFHVGLQKDGTAKKVRLMNYHFAHFFLNPALAIDLGAKRILQYLVEKKQLSPNSSSAVGINRFHGFRSQPLILFALVHEDSLAFRYLLSCPQFEVRSLFNHHHPLDYLVQLKSCFRGNITLPSLPDLLNRLRTLLRRAKGLDMDTANSLSNTTGTPLYDLLFASPNYGEVNHSYDDVDVALVDLYLSSGATTQHFSCNIPCRTEQQRIVAQLLAAATQKERDAIMAKRISM